MRLSLPFVPHLGTLTNLSRAAVLAATIAVTGCGGDGDSTPTSPTTPTTTATRVIGLSGNLAFGSVTVGSSRTASFTIANTGNSTLTVTNIGAATNFVTQSSLSWTSGTIAAGGSQTVTITFTPTTAGSLSGSVMVSGDQTSGTNTIAYSAEVAATATPFSGTWSGTYNVEQCNGSGSLQDLFCSAPSGSRPGGIFPTGTALPIAIALAQSGSAVTGTLSLGNVSGQVTGTVTNDVLTLTGTVTNNGATAVISAWSTQISGNAMTGTASYTVSAPGVAGSAVLVTRFFSVTK